MITWETIVAHAAQLETAEREGREPRAGDVRKLIDEVLKLNEQLTGIYAMPRKAVGDDGTA